MFSLKINKELSYLIPCAKIPPPPSPESFFFFLDNPRLRAPSTGIGAYTCCVLGGGTTKRGIFWAGGGGGGRKGDGVDKSTCGISSKFDDVSSILVSEANYATKLGRRIYESTYRFFKNLLFVIRPFFPFPLCSIFDNKKNLFLLFQQIYLFQKHTQITNPKNIKTRILYFIINYII